MIRPYALFILALIPALCQAQATTAVHRFNCSVDIRPAEKFVRATVASLDPQAIVSIDNAQLKVKIDERILPSRLEMALNRLDRGTFTLDRSGRSIKQGTEQVASPFPQYVDTGNPEANEAAFAQAKQEWRLANPDAFEAARQAQRNVEPVPYE